MEGDGPGSLLIATTPRSGSWLLSDYLAQTGVVAVAREYFHVKYVAALADEAELPTNTITADYIEEVMRRSGSEPGLLSVKIHWVQINQLVDALRLIHPGLARNPAPELIEASLPGTRYIHLTRRDKVRQAVSMFRAMRTEQWWDLGEGSEAETEGRDRPSASPPPPDLLSIRWFEAELQAEDAEWERYFQVFGLSPFTVVYEDLAEDPASVVRSVLDWLGFADAPVPPLGTRLRRQAGSDTELIRTEYLTIRDLLPPLPPAWAWSFRRRCFGLRDDPAVSAEGEVQRPSMEDLTPL